MFEHIYNMGWFNKEVGLIVPPKEQNNKTIKVKSLNGYDSVRETIDEHNTMTVKQPVVTESTKPKTKVSIGL